MSDDARALIAKARGFADRNNGMNWQEMVRELADALEASVQAPAVDKGVLIDALAEVIEAHDVSGGFTNLGKTADWLIASGILQDAAEVEARGLEKAVEGLGTDPAVRLGEIWPREWLRRRAQQVREGNE